MKKKILLFDNYDSFTYNLKHYIEMCGAECEVVLNDKILISNFEQVIADGILISPGPGRPEDAGFLMKFIDYFFEKKPILGVCLGMQALGLKTGAILTKAILPMHGKTSLIEHSGIGCFLEIETPVEVCRYHSLVLKEIDEKQWEITAKTEEKELMAIKHKFFPVEGVQFHPEAILTQFGNKMIQNWISSF